MEKHPGTTRAVLIRLMACLLFLGAQPWLAFGLHASDQPQAFCELGSLTSELEDQLEGQNVLEDFRFESVHLLSAQVAALADAPQGTSDPTQCAIRLALLRVTGRQPAAP
jgi:hypothetical protein